MMELKRPSRLSKTEERKNWVALWAKLLDLTME